MECFPVTTGGTSRSALPKACQYTWVSMEEARWGAVFPAYESPVLMLRADCSLFDLTTNKIMTEAEFDALCAWLAGPEACNFQQQIPGDSESITWTCDGTLTLTRHWM